MQTARRLYVYLLSGISLGALVIGITMLLTVLFEALGLGPTGEVVFGGEDATRQQLTLASAVTAVSLPVWLIHWFVAERSVRPDRPSASVERTSDVRGLYFALAMAALLLAMATGVASMLEAIVLRLAGAETFGRSIGGSLAVAVVAGAAWGYHVLLRTRDWSRGPMTGAGAWLPRTYLYVAVFAGLFLLLGGVTGFIELLGRFILDEPPAFIDSSSGPWWAFPLASAVISVAVGGAVWLGHVWYASRLMLDAGWRGASERPAKLRLAFFVAVLVATAAGTMFLIGDGVGNAIAAALGVPDTQNTGQTVGLIVLPILSAIPYGIAWWIHVRWMDRETESSGSPERVETGDRLQLYPVALVGLAFGATATAWLIGILIDVLLGGERLVAGDVWRRELSQFAPFAVIGVAAWVWRWRGAISRWAVDPIGEASSTTRWTTLLIILAVSIGAGVISIGFILYRLFGSVFGLTLTGDAISELSLPIGVALVAGAVAVYHGGQLRRDQSLRAGIDTSPSEPADTPARAWLRLTGPPGADVDSMLADLRKQLPPGYTLEVVDPPVPPAAVAQPTIEPAPGS
jgi:uncharacterized protein DUF5671